MTPKNVDSMDSTQFEWPKYCNFAHVWKIKGSLYWQLNTTVNKYCICFQMLGGQKGIFQLFFALDTFWIKHPIASPQWKMLRLRILLNKVHTWGPWKRHTSLPKSKLFIVRYKDEISLPPKGTYYLSCLKKGNL